MTLDRSDGQRRWCLVCPELQAFGVCELIERFESGQVSARDVLALIVAGLRGGGWACETQDLLTAEIKGGLAAATKVAGILLSRAFALPEA